tara:strand:- start:1669 stop:1920 length:252 start_codon:yes stop_codon:yes gene_type:complete
MKDINKQIEESFEIKNNFIPPKDQESMSMKFDTNSIDRSGKPIMDPMSLNNSKDLFEPIVSNPAVKTAGEFPPLGTPDDTLIT